MVILAFYNVVGARDSCEIMKNRNYEVSMFEIIYEQMILRDLGLIMQVKATMSLIKFN